MAAENYEYIYSYMQNQITRITRYTFIHQVAAPFDKMLLPKHKNKSKIHIHRCRPHFEWCNVKVCWEKDRRLQSYRLIFSRNCI